MYIKDFVKLLRKIFVDIVYNLLFTITINIEMSYYLNNTARWQYRIIR